MFFSAAEQEVIRAIGTKRAMTLDTVRSVKQIIKLFKFSTIKVRDGADTTSTRLQGRLHEYGGGSFW